MPPSAPAPPPCAVAPDDRGWRQARRGWVRSALSHPSQDSCGNSITERTAWTKRTSVTRAMTPAIRDAPGPPPGPASPGPARAIRWPPVLAGSRMRAAAFEQRVQPRTFDAEVPAQQRHRRAAATVGERRPRRAAIPRQDGEEVLAGRRGHRPARGRRRAARAPCPGRQAKGCGSRQTQPTDPRGRRGRRRSAAGKARPQGPSARSGSRASSAKAIQANRIHGS